jgi:hypothetical protein
MWTVDLATKTRTQLTFAQEPAGSFMTWSPDGRTLAYSASRDTRFAIARRPVAGRAEQIVFTLSLDRVTSPRVTAWTNDGSAILYSGSTEGGIWSLSLAPGPSSVRSAQVAGSSRSSQARLSGRIVGATVAGSASLGRRADVRSRRAPSTRRSPCRLRTLKTRLASAGSQPWNSRWNARVRSRSRFCQDVTSECHSPVCVRRRRARNLGSCCGKTEWLRESVSHRIVRNVEEIGRLALAGRQGFEPR